MAKDYSPDMIRDLDCAVQNLSNFLDGQISESALITARFQVLGVLGWLREKHPAAAQGQGQLLN